MAVREISAQGSTQSDLLYTALAAWERAGIRYCVLHGYDEFTDSIPSDVDCMVDPSYSLQRIVACVESDDIHLVQHLQHEATCHYLVFHRPGTGQFLTLDISGDYRRNGRVFYSGQEILARRQRHGAYWVPAPEHEFGYYLVKKIAKGSLEARHAHRLSELFRIAPDACREQIVRFWRDPAASLLQQAASSEDWSAVTDQLPHLRRPLLWPGRTAVTYWVREALRRATRWTHPTGLHVAFLGPDGSGKSTIVNGVDHAISGAFRDTLRLHLQPSLLRRRSSGIPVTSPHGSPPRGVVSSVVKLCAWFVDYHTGYYVRVRPSLVRSTLVLFDRYYLDLLVDPARYRYGGSRRLAASLWRLLPKPDVVVALDAPAELLHQRKREVPLAETERQRLAYRELVTSMPNGHIVDASQPPESVVRDVSALLMQHLADRTAHRLGLRGKR